MYTICLIFTLLLVTGLQAVTWQCRNASAPNYVLAGYIKCDLDLRAQCGCGSWCGIAGPPTTDDTIPKCVPRIDTPDSAPPKPEGGNPCPLQECPFASFNLVKCPPFTNQYSYVGASCNKINGACVWQLPFCPPVYPAGNARANTCTNKPANPPVGESFQCTGWYGGMTTDYQCLHDGVGGTKWMWQPCPGTQTCPEGVVQYSSGECLGASCGWKTPQCTDCPDFPAECGSPQTITQQEEYCGGCNCRVFKNNVPICLNKTLLMPFNASLTMGIECKSGYKYQSTWPFCVPINPLSCSTMVCPTDEICMEMWNRDGVYSKYIPTCKPKPRMTDITTVPCSEVSCNDGYTCQTDSTTKKWSCVRNAAVSCPPASCTEAKKFVCWDGSRVGNGCYFSQSGQCEWGYAPCPVYNKPATNGSALNCQVGQWTGWSCKAPCGQWSRQTRTRSITQQNSTTGFPCPHLLEAGDDCQGNSSTGCVNPPVTNSVASVFTSSSITGYTASTGFVQLISSTTGADGAYVTAATIGSPSTAGPPVSSTVSAGTGGSQTTGTTGTGTTPGSTGTTPGSTGTTPGSTGTTPGSTGTTPGSTGTTPGSTGTTPGSTSTPTSTTPGATSSTPTSTTPGATSSTPTSSTPGATSSTPTSTTPGATSSTPTSNPSSTGNPSSGNPATTSTGTTLANWLYVFVALVLATLKY